MTTSLVFAVPSVDDVSGLSIIFETQDLLTK